MYRPLLAAVLLFVSAARAGAQEEPPFPPVDPAPLPAEAARPQRVDVGWRWNLTNPGRIDRHNVSALSIGAMDAFHVAMGDSGADGAPLRVLKWGASIWYAVAVDYMAHEYGHLSVIAKTGNHDAVFGTDGQTRSEWSALSTAQLFVKGLNPHKDTVVSVREGDWNEILEDFGDDPDAMARLNLMLEAGGFNQEQALVSRYGSRVRDGAFSYLDTTGYLWTALGTIRYPVSVDQSDLADYSALLEARGYRASPARIKALSALRFAGGSGLVGAGGFIVGFLTGRGGTLEPLSVEAFDGARVYWPELESYLTQAGPSVRLSVPLRLRAVELIPSVERSFAGGDEILETALRVRIPLFAFLAIDGALHRSDVSGSWRAVGCGLFPLSWFAVTAGYEAGAGYTFERDVYGSGNGFLEEHERSVLLGVRLGVAF